MYPKQSGNKQMSSKTYNMMESSNCVELFEFISLLNSQFLF